MDKFVWNKYPRSTRIALTIGLGVVGVMFIVAGLAGWSSLPIFAAAIAFHTEYSLTIDPAKDRFELRRIVKPFAAPIHGPIASIRTIRLNVSLVEQRGPVFSASVVFQKVEGPFKIASGDMDYVLHAVSSLVKATKLPVTESDLFRVQREKYAAASSVLTFKP